MGGPQSRSKRGGEEKNSHPLRGIEPPIIQPVAQRYSTEVSRLQINNIRDRISKMFKECNKMLSQREFRMIVHEKGGMLEYCKKWTDTKDSMMT
jgi:hypothetical protein